MDLLTTLQAPLADRYRLERELGRGGMAIVFLADDLKHQRRVAIKVLRPELSASVGQDRFLQEITLAAGLQHPHILPLYDSGVVGSGPEALFFYVMPFVDGESLRARLERDGELPIDDAIEIASEVLGALGHAHTQGIIHRDIKPENILLSGGHALVADFGIARALSGEGRTRLTERGSVVGTPAYMSPEQAAGEREVDARSDLYSLACVFYEMLAGEPPFTGHSAQSIMARRLAETPPSIRTLRETVPVELEAAVSRALARHPADRFASAAEFRGAIRNQYRTPSSVPPVAPRGRRWFLPAALLVVVVAAMVWRLAPKVPAQTGWRLALTDLSVLTRDSSTDYLRSGIPDYLVTALRRLPGLEVMPMSLVRRDSAITSPVDLGKKLGASVVLTGNLARFGGRLAVNAELVQVAGGRLLWSGQFDYPDTAYAELIPTIVAVIADSLRLQLRGGDRRDAIERSTIDPVVLDLLLRGQQWWVRGSAGAPGDSATVDSARVFYQRVLDRSPTNAHALAGMGDFYLLSFIRGWAVPGLTAAEVHARGDSLVHQALSLDSTIANAWNQVAISRLYLEDDFDGAWVAIERAVALDSGFTQAYRFRGIYRHELQGDLPGGLVDYQRSVEAGQNVLNLNTLGAGLMAARRYPEAAAVLERSMALRPSPGASSRLVTAYERMGRHEDAVRIRHLQDPTGASAAPFEAALAAHDTAAYARAYRASLRKSADSLIARLGFVDVVPAERYNVAEIRIGALLCELGDSKKAMDLVEDLYRIRPKRLRWIVTNVDLGCLRQDPRYLPMVKAAGLEPFLRN